MSILDNAPNMAEAMEWGNHLKAAEDFMPQARKAWSNFTNKPWNRHAMLRVLAEFSAAQAVRSEGDTDGN